MSARRTRATGAKAEIDRKRAAMLALLQTAEGATLGYKEIAERTGMGVATVQVYAVGMHGRRSRSGGNYTDEEPEPDVEVRVRVANIHLATHLPPPCQCPNMEAAIRPMTGRARVFKTPRIKQRAPSY